jgi:hypothetical protein
MPRLWVGTSCPQAANLRVAFEGHSACVSGPTPEGTEIIALTIQRLAEPERGRRRGAFSQSGNEAIPLWRKHLSRMRGRRNEA